MKKLLLLLFVTALFSVNAQSYKYDFKAKVDIEAAIQTTDLNDIYNQVGVHSLGYGYYVATAIGRRDADIKAYNLVNSYNKQGTTTERISKTSFQFRQNGQNYTLTKIIFLHKDNWYWYPVLTRREAIEVVSEMKELLELDLITQQEYNEEFEKIKRVIK